MPRDDLAAHRERAYQAMGLFLFPAIWKYLECGVTAMGIQNGSDVFPHVYNSCPTEMESIISW